MSQWVNIVCHDCRVSLFFGKLVQPEGAVQYLHLGSGESVRNSENSDLTRALWKFIAEHVDHSVAIVSDHSEEEFERISDYSQIDGDTDTDISMDDYLAGFPG